MLSKSSVNSMYPGLAKPTAFRTELISLRYITVGFGYPSLGSIPIDFVVTAPNPAS